ncbi:cyclopropane-fatty-acyl-phospholipid synthase [Rhodotorula sp. JG-1b]|nr:cyclopropane-fatty-acyl-phospholipid synthase [Rhodotorula sp. JG-1b]
MSISKEDKWSAERYNSNASFVYSSAYTSPTLDLLSAQPGERILDLGCGSGELTLAALLPAVQPNGSIVGFDASPDLLAKARSNAASSPLSDNTSAPVTWIEGDGHDLEKSEEKGGLDAVFSNAALHWMKRDPAQVVRGVYGLLKPGGRFVGEMGGAMNMIGVRSVLHTVLDEHGVDAAAVDPWFFPTPAQYSAILQAAGFRVESCELIPRPTPLPESGLAGWLDTFAFAFLDALPATVDREQVKAEVCRRLEVDMKHGEQWTTMYVRLRFKAWKE